MSKALREEKEAKQNTNHELTDRSCLSVGACFAQLGVIECAHSGVAVVCDSPEWSCTIINYEINFCICFPPMTGCPNGFTTFFVCLSFVIFFRASIWWFVSRRGLCHLYSYITLATGDIVRLTFQLKTIHWVHRLSVGRLKRDLTLEFLL